MPRILVIEDSSTVQAYLCRALRLQGYAVFAALNGEQGLAQARACRPDLVTMDCRMPKMDGVQAAQLMAQDIDLLQIPIIFVSSEDDRNRLEEVLRLPNIAGYLLKPVNAETLLARIEKILSLRLCAHSNPAWDTVQARSQRLAERPPAPGKRAAAHQASGRN